MRRSCKIGAEAISKTMSRSRHLKTESQFLATMEHEVKMKGADHLAYPPVVAAGNNSTIIHYISATGAVEPSDLLLMDAGCEYHGYSSDITRTWPTDGTFSDPMKCMYEAVLSTQRKLMKTITPYSSTVDGLYNQMMDILGEQLVSTGLVSDADKNLLKARAHDFCPHHVSHYLGMDVHDTPLIPKNRPLEPGMVITLEPAIYVPRHKAGLVRPEFLGLGVRIEDDLLITEDGVELLTAGCPSTVQDVEELVGGGEEEG